MLTRQQFLRFQLQPFDSAHGKPLMALMEIDLVTELINVPIDRVVPIPHLPAAVMGVYNWRGEVLWIVNLAMLLGIKGARSSTRSLQPTMILSSSAQNEDRKPKIVGLVVDEIAEIEWCNLDSIQAIPDDLDPEFSRWVSGVWVSATADKFLVLNGHKMIDEANFHADV